VPTVVSTPEIRVACPDDVKFALVEKAKAYFAAEDCVMIDIDGMRLTFDDGWALLRASNTQPALVMRFEAKHQQSLTKIRGLVESWLNSALKETI
jgi:phosphomannomutase/phosphoglucomutase